MVSMRVPQSAVGMSLVVDESQQVHGNGEKEVKQDLIRRSDWPTFNKYGKLYDVF